LPDCAVNWLARDLVRAFVRKLGYIAAAAAFALLVALFRG